MTRATRPCALICVWLLLVPSAGAQSAPPDASTSSAPTSSAEPDAPSQAADAAPGEAKTGASSSPVAGGKAPAPAGDNGSSEDASRVAEARGHFQRGVELYAEGDVGGALVEFEAAYDLQPSYKLLFNMGQVRAELRDYAGAERDLLRYLEEGGSEIDPQRRATVKAELARLQERIGLLTVESSVTGASVFIDDVPVGETPLIDVPVSAGPRRLRVQKTGYETHARLVHVVGGEPLTLDITLQPATALALDYPSADRVDSGPDWALWLGAGSGVLLLTGAGLGYWAYLGDRAYDDGLERETSRAELDRLADRAEERALLTDVVLLAGTATAVAALVVWLVDGDSGSSLASAPSVQLRPDRLTVSF